MSIKTKYHHCYIPHEHTKIQDTDCSLCVYAADNPDIAIPALPEFG